MIASGNGGDLYDVGGSPGNAVTTIAVANSIDAYSQLDALEVTAPASCRRRRTAPRARRLRLGEQPGPRRLGRLRLTDPTNQDGCDPLSAADAAAVAGKIAWVEWTERQRRLPLRLGARGRPTSADRRCHRLRSSPATRTLFAAGITGSALIPGVIITNSASDTLRRSSATACTRRTARSAADSPSSSTVTTTWSTAAPRAAYRAEGGVKPDVSAVGTTRLLDRCRHGQRGCRLVGTSMATPMVAGLAALVVAEHPDWTVEEVKANIMNTAGQDLFTEPNHTRSTYAPNRVGAGRVNAEHALENAVMAYVHRRPGRGQRLVRPARGHRAGRRSPRPSRSSTRADARRRTPSRTRL